MPAIGYAAQALALVLAIYALVTAVLGAVKKRQDFVLSARNATLATTVALTVAVLALEYLLLTGHYQTEYVSSVTNSDASIFFKATALWGGQNGSILFFAWLMSLFISATLLTKWGAVQHLIPWAVATMQFVLSFFVMLVVTVANPFTQLPFFPADGQGLNPLLYHWGMVIHPPVLYVGFVAFIVPYAFAVAALITRQRGDLWMRTTRRWNLVAWIFLTLGLLLGGRWAYDVLGWGGYWGWDPVENAALIPWLVATPFLHSVMMQENRGLMKRWNVALIMLTFVLIIEGTFLTRSGVIGSVHTFAQSAIGPLFMIFIGVMFFASLGLFVWRWDDLGSDNEIDSMLSREAAFLLNNFLFLALAFVVWWGTHFPIISEAFTGEKIVVGPPFFKQVTGPIFAALVLLMGVAPLMPWRRATPAKFLQRIQIPGIIALVGAGAIYFLTALKAPGAIMAIAFVIFAFVSTTMEYWRGIRARQRTHNENFLVALSRLTSRNRRRYGGYLIHFGVIVSAVGIIGMEFYQVETQQNIGVGETMVIESPFVGSYELTFLNLADVDSPPGMANTEAVLQVSRNGNPVGEIRPLREFFLRQRQPMTIPDVHRDLLTELYVIVAGWENDGQSATFKAYINPLINWLWFGGILFVIGTIVAAGPAPRAERRRAAAPASKNTVMAK